MEVFGENDPQEVKVPKKKLAWRALPYVRPRLLSYRAWESVHGYGLYAWLGKQKSNNERHATPIFHHHVGDATADTTVTQFGRVVDLRDIITLAKFENKRVIIVALVSG